jgi:succinyl-diaminopimelate desuccinylase
MLDLTADPVVLTRFLVDLPSVSGDERAIADAVEEALAAQGHFEVLRIGNNVVARTHRGATSRVILAGHLDTVPIADNVPSTVDGHVLRGCGASDMKSGDAVMLHLAATVTDSPYDLTFVFYDNEEVEAARNGLGHLPPELLDADFAILLEPTDGIVEAGCQGTMRADITTSGKRAHSARSWLGDNAIHRLGEVLRRLDAYAAREVDIDGCRYREGLNAVRIDGGVAGNVIPDAATVSVNFRFAPDRDVVAAEAHLREVFVGFDVTVTDAAPGALPGLGHPVAQEFLRATNSEPRGKFGWTDVARFAALGIPAVNFGPGDPNLAHTREEWVDTRKITAATETLRAYLTG